MLGEYLVILTVKAPDGDITVNNIVTIAETSATNTALKNAANGFSMGMAVHIRKNGIVFFNARV